MITGTHVVLHSTDAPSDRAFLRDVLGLPHVVAGPDDADWLIFALPPAEVGVHPATGPSVELYLVCDDLAATLADLAAHGVEPDTGPTELSWGVLVTVPLPSGARIGVYEARHTTTFDRGV